MSAFTNYLETVSRQAAPVREEDLLFKFVLLDCEPTTLKRMVAVLNQQLVALPATTPKSVFSTLMRLIAHLDERREEAELAANPERRAGIERVGEHFARKAQSGWSSQPLPELPPDAQ
ncbi:hypothetical protein J0X19_00935 [Hymenobacter sp. BT186]|uniref:Uncharacterized protein n=1 Tax=Hymenobacter telluris TaxID=2816474 RepID=A0A939ET72_9BACT|nr:hypothetical protein [Hymenobacter telluris]MBO0356496.1 hypothetical protein [Hymenobacter telluris]MBW3372520.1 hypothetical protein [Hymenobacter norwichensis]